MKTKLFLTFLTLAAASAFGAESAKVGSAAPGFSLPDANGKTHSLADYKGKYVILEWFNPECPFVKKHYGSDNMQKLQQEAAGRGLVWLSINSSAPGQQGNLSPDAAKKVTTDLKMKSTALLLDPDGKAGKAYGAKTTPHMYVIDQQGKLIYDGAIDSKASADVADIAGATNYVRAALQDAMAGQPVKESSTKPYGCSVKY